MLGEGSGKGKCKPKICYHFHVAFFLLQCTLASWKPSFAFQGSDKVDFNTICLIFIVSVGGQELWAASNLLTLRSNTFFYLKDLRLPVLILAELFTLPSFLAISFMQLHIMDWDLVVYWISFWLWTPWGQGLLFYFSYLIVVWCLFSWINQSLNVEKKLQWDVGGLTESTYWLDSKMQSKETEMSSN